MISHIWGQWMIGERLDVHDVLYYHRLTICPSQAAWLHLWICFFSTTNKILVDQAVSRLLGGSAIIYSSSCHSKPFVFLLWNKMLKKSMHCIISGLLESCNSFLRSVNMKSDFQLHLIQIQGHRDPALHAWCPDVQLCHIWCVLTC